jgi:hypothetical protein
MVFHCYSVLGLFVLLCSSVIVLVREFGKSQVVFFYFCEI